MLSVLYFWPLCCLFFPFGHCVVCPLLLAIVLSVLYFWPLCCLFFPFGHCVVCPLLLAIVLSVLYFWPLCCLSFTFGHCVVCSLLLAIVLSVLYFWPLCCLFFFDLRILITPLVSSNSSYMNIYETVENEELHGYSDLTSRGRCHSELASGGRCPNTLVLEVDIRKWTHFSGIRIWDRMYLSERLCHSAHVPF